MELTRPAIHGDEVFERFRRKLADVVTVAINSGKRCGGGPDFHCPMGCHPCCLTNNPIPVLGAELFGITTEQALHFMRGFDGSYKTARNTDEELFHALGRLYRERFK